MPDEPLSRALVAPPPESFRIAGMLAAAWAAGVCWTNEWTILPAAAQVMAPAALLVASVWLLSRRAARNAALLSDALVLGFAVLPCLAVGRVEWLPEAARLVAPGVLGFLVARGVGCWASGDMSRRQSSVCLAPWIVGVILEFWTNSPEPRCLLFVIMSASIGTISHSAICGAARVRLIPVCSICLAVGIMMGSAIRSWTPWFRPVTNGLLLAANAGFRPEFRRWLSYDTGFAEAYILNARLKVGGMEPQSALDAAALSATWSIVMLPQLALLLVLLLPPARKLRLLNRLVFACLMGWCGWLAIRAGPSMIFDDPLGAGNRPPITSAEAIACSVFAAWSFALPSLAEPFRLRAPARVAVRLLATPLLASAIACNSAATLLLFAAGELARPREFQQRLASEALQRASAQVDAREKMHEAVVRWLDTAVRGYSIEFGAGIVPLLEEATASPPIAGVLPLLKQVRNVTIFPSGPSIYGAHLTRALLVLAALHLGPRAESPEVLGELLGLQESALLLVIPMADGNGENEFLLKEASRGVSKVLERQVYSNERPLPVLMELDRAMTGLLEVAEHLRTELPAIWRRSEVASERWPHRLLKPQWMDTSLHIPTGDLARYMASIRWRIRFHIFEEWVGRQPEDMEELFEFFPTDRGDFNVRRGSMVDLRGELDFVPTAQQFIEVYWVGEFGKALGRIAPQAFRAEKPFARLSQP